MDEKRTEMFEQIITKWLFRAGMTSALFVFLMACTSQTDQDHAHSPTKEYTCPMHPGILQDKPGKCPVCGMDLVEVKERDEMSAGLMLTDSQIKLANITTQVVSTRPVGQTLVLNAKLSVDEQQSEAISSRAAGRIERLFIKESGQTVRKGQPLYSLYSENILTLQQEYLLAREQYNAFGETEKRYKSFLDATVRKLRLYGLTADQISKLTTRDSLVQRVTFLAPASGTVTEINGAEGQYVAEGTSLYRIEDIGSLWVEAELYPEETSLVKVGDRIHVSVSGHEDGPIAARVSFLNPEFRNNTQVTILRAPIENTGNTLKPGQHAQVVLTHSSHEALAIPSDAVIRDAHGSHVYVQSGINTFVPRMVSTGIEGFDLVEITGGLNEGDTIAATGAYLLYSEMILKKGTDPMAGHDHP